MTDAKRFLRDVLTWKKEDLDGIRERILTAIGEADGCGAARDLLLENAKNTGKMLRPLMMLMAAEDYRPEQREELLWSAAAGEMLHAASLLLDDAIDGAPIRRGKPSIQAKYGVPASICAGTFLLATACSCLLRRGFYDSAAHLMRVTELVCDGELLQDLGRYQTGVTEEIYLKSVRGKTAVPFSFSGEIASRISGHDEKTQKVFAEFGTAFGTVFQLYDDIMDWIGTEAELGKPVCEDFKNGIYTLPAIFAFRDKTAGAELLSLAGEKGSIMPDGLRRAKQLVAETGGIRYAKEVVDREAEKAAALLDCLQANRYTRTLRQLVAYADRPLRRGAGI